MKLTWHLVRKDLRRLAGPVALWLAFLGVMALWLARLHVPDDVVRANGTAAWSDTLGAMVSMLSLMQVVAGGLLAGFLMLEDPVGGTTAHWLTKPIAGRRMLAAKLLAAALLFVAAPVAALLPAWLAAGYTTVNCASAATAWVLVQGGQVLTAMALASLARNLAHYVMLVAVYAVVMGVGMSRLPAQWLGVEVAFNGSPGLLIGAVVLPSLAVVLAVQFGARDTRRGWAVLGVAFVVAALARICWPVAPTARVHPAEESVVELPARAGAEAQGGGSWLRIAGFTPGERGQVSALVMEERRHGGAFSLQRTTGGSSDFFIREGANGARRRLRADPMSEVGQNAIVLRVWRLVPEDGGDWPADGILARGESPKTRKEP
jgi:hypothetical protein